MGTRLRTIATILSVLSATVLSGQNPGYPTLTGMPDYGTFIHSQIDTVDLLTGAVKVHIPLISRKARGFDYAYGYQYDSRFWQVFTSVGTYTDPSTGTTYPAENFIWDAGTGLFPESAGLGGGFTSSVGGRVSYNEQIYVCSQYPSNQATPADVRIRSNWQYISGDGTVYNFPVRSAEIIKTSANTCIDDVANTPQLLIGLSDNGQMKIDISNFHTTGTVKVWFKNGSQHTFTATGSGSVSQLTDANGNQCCSLQNGWVTDSLGRPLRSTHSTSDPNVTAIDYYDSTGQLRTIQARQTSVQISTAFPSTGNPPQCTFTQGSTSLNVIQSLTLANGLSYTFSYDDPNNPGHSNPYGEITKITLPTGGYIKYKWATIAGRDPGPNDLTCAVNLDARVLVERRVSSDGVTEAVWQYSYTGSYFTSGTSTASVTDPQGNVQVHTFAGPYGAETQAEYRQGSTTVLKTVKQDWASDTGPTTASQTFSYNDPTGSLSMNGARNPRVIRVTTTLAATNQVAKTETDYADCYTYAAYQSPTAGPNFTDCPDNPTQTREFDYGAAAAGPEIRYTNFSYLHASNSSYFNAHIWNRVTDKQVFDAGGSLKARTQFSYDTTAVTATSGVPYHDYTNYLASNTLRGNQTVISRWRSTDGVWLATTNSFNDVGNLVQTTDANGNSTSFSYADNFTDGVNRTSQGYLTQVTHPVTNGVNHIGRKQYFWNSGAIAASCGENFPAASACTNACGPPQPDYAKFTYDLLDRPLSIVQGDGGQTTLTFNESSLPITASSSAAITSTQNVVHSVVIDGLARAQQTQLNSDPLGDFVDITYDALGRVSTVSNPHRTAASSTDGTVSTQYDAVGRVTQVTKQDGSVVTTQYDQTSTNSPNGACSTTTDEAGKQRKSCLDGLARLIEVDEPQASTGSMTNPYVTLYSYDVLGNLLQVNQKGDGSQAARVRTFTYDSLSRLLTAANPESGTISNSYDANGNVLQRTSPAPNQTGSATETISYCYDALNRVTGKVYSAQNCPLTSPAVIWAYDSGTNAIGHLTSLTDKAGSGSYSYDVMGRIAGESRTLAGITKSMSYLYNLDGSIQSLTYPSGAVITYTPDAAGRMLSAVDNGNHINYVTGSGGPDPASGATYGPDGSILSFNQGWTTSFAGIANSFSYNPRLQPVNMAAVSPGTAGTGTSATASVTIGGSLQTATQAAAAGSPMTTLASGGVTTTHVLMPGGHLYALYCSGNPMSCSGKDETAAGGNVTPASGSPLVTALSGQTPYTFFFNGGQIYDNWCTTSGCAWDNPYGDAGRGPDGAAPAIASASPLNVVATTNGLIAYYLTSSGHVVWLNTSQGFSNTWQDVTAAGGNITAAAGTQMVTLLSGQSPLTLFFTADGQLDDNWCTSSTSCTWDNPFGDTAQGPDGHAPAIASGSPLNAVATANGVIAYYLSSTGHVIALNTSLGFSDTWQDVTAAGGNITPASGSPLVTVLNGQTPYTFFFSGGQLYDNWCTTSGCSWDNPYGDAASGPNGAAPAIASGSPLNVVATANGLIAHYLSTSGHVIALNTSQGLSDTWQDLSALAAPDTGTVSLSVGGFTATACFGTNIGPASACSGQPVNTTPSQVASALVVALNNSASPVTATANGATINLTWKATGPFTTAVNALSTSHDNPSLFPNPSFTSPATNFSGGSGANLSVFSLNYDFHVGNGDNGNVFGITNNKDTTRNQAFTYDALNRLTSAQNAGTDCTKTLIGGKPEYWGNSYGYDAWGNLLSKSVTKCSAENMNFTATSNNQLSGLGYDAAGNITKDNLGQTYTFDAENRITGAAAFTYTYDADGNRVEKSNGTTGTLYWYMSPGIVAESDLSGNLQSEYVFFNGERVARKDFPGGAVSYYFSDHLKTTDIVTDAQGNIKNESDYYPFGGELQFANSDSNHYKFTGKERDQETQLDYFGARYYSNGLGRFISADPPLIDQHPGDPQSWNLYSYVRNNPLRFTDPTGNSLAGCENIATCQPMDNEGTNNASGTVTEAADPAPDPDELEQEAERGQVESGSKGRDVAIGITKEVFSELNSLNPAARATAQITALLGLPDPLAASNANEAKAMKYTAIVLFFVPGGGEEAAAAKAEAKAQRVFVYVIKEGERIVYVGITNDLKRRGAEHGAKLLELLQAPSRKEARAAEQLLIERLGLKNLRNKINSISTRNPFYKEAIKIGEKLLEDMKLP